MFHPYQELAFSEFLYSLSAEPLLCVADNQRKKNNDVTLWELKKGFPNPSSPLALTEFHLPDKWTPQSFADFCSLFYKLQKKEKKSKIDIYPKCFEILDAFERRNRWEDVPLLIAGLTDWLDPFNARVAEALRKITGENFGTASWWGRYLYTKQQLKKNPDLYR